MFRKMLSKVLSVAIVGAMAMVTCTGCGSAANETVEIIQEEVPTSDSVDAGYVQAFKDEESGAEYFTKGVYVNYAADTENPEKTYFYVFNGDGTGRIEDGATNSGMYFEYEQEEGLVNFKFGSELKEDTLTVKDIDNGFVRGAYKDCFDLIFEPVADADPDTFDAVNYVFAANGEDLLYTDPNGWSMRYNPECIVATNAGPMSTFVYTGDCAGTCMMTTTYDVGKDAKTAAEDLAKEWGVEAKVTECVFPGTEDVTGYYVYITPADGGIGLVADAFVRDYMDGYLVFEFTIHNSGDDLIDIPVSDAFATMIDTLSFQAN